MEYGARQIAGYRIVRPLGSGSLGEVCEAKRLGGEGFDARVAMKVISNELAQDVRFWEMLSRLAQHSMRLAHANIVQTLDVGRDPESGAHYIVSELVNGIPLSILIEQLVRSGVQPPPGLALWIASEVAKALDHAHRAADGDGRRLGILHGDLSPANVFVGFDGQVKVADFGLAEALFHRNPNAPTLARKWNYSSPERAANERLGPASDLFSLGTVMFELLSGQNPFERPGVEQTRRALATLSNPPRLLEFRADASDTLANIVESLLTRHPSDRVASAARLHASLKAYDYESGSRFGPAELAALIKEKAAEQSPAPPPLRSLFESVVDDSSPEIEVRYELLEPRDSLPPPPPAITGEASLNDATVLVFASVEPAPDEALAQIDAMLNRYGARVLGLGRETVAIFGLDQPDGRDSEGATRCALTVLRMLGRTMPSLSCGLAAARVRVNPDGTLDQAVLRESIDQARALSGRRGWVVVDRRSARQLQRVFELEPLGSQGNAWAVEEARAEPLGEFVGRKQLLRQLGELLRRAHGGRLHVIGLVGGAGIGKTRFLNELVRRIRNDGGKVGYSLATCPPEGYTAPLSAVDSMLRALCDIREGESRARILSAEPELRSIGLSEAAARAVLVRLGATVADSNELPPLSSVTTQLWASLARDRLYVLGWDDAQELDAASRDLISASITSLAGARAVFLFAARPDEHALYRELPGYSEIQLGELDRREARRLIEKRLGVDRVPDRVFAYFDERAGGHPMFLEELAYEAIESGGIVVANRYVESANLEAMQVPRTVRAALSHRVRRLPDDQRNVLIAAAVLGAPVDVALLAKLTDTKVGVLNGLLEALEARDLIRRDRYLAIEFPSPLVAEVVLEGLDAEVVARRHQRAAEAYRALFEDGDEVAVRIAEHLHRAGDATNAARYFAKGGLSDLRSGRFDAAAIELSRALTHCDLATIEGGALSLQLSALAQAVTRSQERTAVVRAAERLLEDLPKTRIDDLDERTRANAKLELARIFSLCDRESQAKSVLAQVLDLAKAFPEVWRAALTASAEIALRRGDFAEALELIGRTGELGTGGAREEHRLLLTQAQALATVDRHEEALAAVERASSLVPPEDATLACERARTRAIICAFRGDWRGCAQASEEAAEQGRNAGLTREVAANLHNQGEALVRIGEFAQGYAALHASLALAEETSSERTANFDRLFLAYLDALDGLPGADEMISTCMAIAERRGWTLDQLTGRYLFGKVLAQRGEIESARTELHAVRARALEVGHRPLARDCGYELELLEPTLHDSRM